MKPSRLAFALRLLTCVVSLALIGCMKPAYTEGPYDDYDYDEDMAAGYGGYGDGGGGGGGGGGEYDYRADMVEAEEAPPAPSMTLDGANISSRGRAARQRASFKTKGKAERELAPSGDASASTETTSAEPEPLDVEAPEQGPAPVSKKRQVIYTATMQVSVYDVPAAIEIVEDLPNRYGGWMHQRVDNQIVLRIPAAKLDEAIATVAALGIVDYRLLEALDVTAEYTDLESRIRVMAETQAHLQALLLEAKTVEQALEIRRALDQITLELEAARAQLRELSKSIAFSTLILRIVQRGPAQELPSSNDPFPWVDELGVEATDFR